MTNVDMPPTVRYQATCADIKKELHEISHQIDARNVAANAEEPTASQLRNLVGLRQRLIEISAWLNAGLDAE